MKIVSWNCNGKFREKYSFLGSLNADIYVVQECENPKKYKKQFEGFYSDYIWYGEKDSKGLGIFVRENIEFVINDWPIYCLRHFLSIRINNDFDLIGVWASPPYIEEYYIYQTVNLERYNSRTIIIGDFNSNAIWDKSHGRRNHSAVVNELKNVGLYSAYHFMMNEKEGEESQKTFYLYRHYDKGYHIDYCFLDPRRINSFQILTTNDWIQYSDHFPIEICVDT
ncbi:MAG: endonuclease/exonuclease/phosphatase family protein [Clostridia bacterium]|nr:endonuclease/exonuclease/phosphatase family protein [Clostridia bacterium]MBO5258714.1 endonuclease/exonuclease/phosphatase family protein [Clostridia bacterium]